MNTTTTPVDAPEQLFGALSEELGPSAVLTGAEIPNRNCKDWHSLPQVPLAVIRPVDAQGLSSAVVECRRLGLPFVAQGGLTGLCGGAVPEAGWVAISLERMTGIDEIDRAALTMTVKAGTPLETIQTAADDADLFFPLDLGARGSCAIGGNLSTNAGGNRVMRYGMTRELVLGVEVVLPDGTIITGLNKLLKNNSGYDLKQLFIGSEGTLGIITRAVLRLFPKPKSTMTALCRVDDYGAVVALLQSARRDLGPLLSAFEVMWPDFWETATTRAGVRPPLTGGEGFYVLLEVQGTDQQIDAPRLEYWIERTMDLGLVSDATIAQSLAQTHDFWAVRDTGELGRMIGPRLSYDIGLPVSRMDEFATNCKASLGLQIPSCQSIHFGHIGDGNLHLFVWVPGSPAGAQPKDVVDGIVYGLVKEMSGSISAEHGIGSFKKKWLGHARSEAEIALMRTLKKALDPDNLLNPGRVI
ncbi:FAD-binding oxidoreductase [Bradyrhizobium sp. UFLA01-814]|uniref:FAD-binding oxidoreductase n=1 Tax=Bradyrhizobium sp. UFLA01-814 TaxID=3023480 RepID=UPI00398B31B7